jgi:hypothetical protein
MPKVREPRHQVVMDFVPDSGIRLFGNVPRRSCERFASLFRSTCDCLPAKDRKKMLAHCRRINAHDPPTLLFVDYSPSLLPATSSAMCHLKTSETWFESRVMQASTGAGVKAVIAHELGHLRSYCDPDNHQHDCDLAEDEANSYAQLWGFPFVDNLYKTSDCDDLQKFARHLGMRWRIFFVDGFFGSHFTCLRLGERMEAKYSDFLDIGDNAEEVREYMRDLPTKYYVRRR